jgi:hypothetical protein
MTRPPPLLARPSVSAPPSRLEAARIWSSNFTRSDFAAPSPAICHSIEGNPLELASFAACSRLLL